VRGGLFDEALAVGALVVKDDPFLLVYLVVDRDKPNVIYDMSYRSDVKTFQDRLDRLNSLV